MNRERWQLVRDLLDKAIAIPASERPAFLDKAALEIPSFGQKLNPS